MKNPLRSRSADDEKTAKDLLKKYTGKIKLNVGCGTDYKKGWINIDNNSDNNIDKLDLNWDLRKPLPFEDNTVDFIFNEHLIEHLTVDESRKAIQDFMRALKPGGVMRVAMPDLDKAIELYLDKNWKNKSFIKRFNMQHVQTNAELLNMSFSFWGHKWLYNQEELRRRFSELGYENVKMCKHGKSSHTELRNLETREESLLIAEVVK